MTTPRSSTARTAARRVAATGLEPVAAGVWTLRGGVRAQLARGAG